MKPCRERPLRACDEKFCPLRARHNRRFETAALKSTIEQFDEVVIAVGGSLVSEPESFELLLSSCYTIWVKASAQEHMDRVVAQRIDDRHNIGDDGLH